MQTIETRNGLQGRKILMVSIPLILLVIGVSLVGLLYPQIYRATTPNWLAQSVGQDAIDLFLIAPILIAGTIYSFSSNRVAVYLWIGTLLYLVYTFLIYCFTVRFNPMFIPYCIVLGISTFSVIWFFSGNKDIYYGNTGSRMLPAIGIYFVSISVIFCSLWLAEVIPATIHNEIPKSISDAGLITNPVHVIDLSLFLPATFIVGVMAIRRNIFATLWSPVLLTFFILMDLTIAALSIIMSLNEVGGSYSVAIVMIGLAALSLFLFVRFMKFN